MLALLPLVSFVCLLLVLRQFQVLDWRGSILLAAVVWGLLLTAITEFLSLGRWLTFWGVLGAWSLVLLLLVIMLAVGKRKGLGWGPPLPPLSISSFERSLRVGLVGSLLIIATVGVIAWVAPPNTWDSLTYHMSRVMHWMQNRSVAFYPTHILRQLYLNPWSEFGIVHFQILSGGDRFANLIQWFSLAGSVVGVSLLAKELDAPRRGQVFAAVVCATIPMAILQGSSTQTDLVVSFWLVCFVYFALLLRRNPNLLYAVAAGAALGLAMLTKATAYVVAVPFLIWLSVSAIKRIPLVLGLAVLINVGHYARNYDLFGRPLGPGGEGDIVFANETHSVPAMTSNLIRNVALHLGTPVGRVNAGMENAIAWVHRRIGISPNDARTTWPGTQFHIRRLSTHEDIAGNPIHVFLIAASLLLYIRWRPRPQDVGVYAVSVLFAFLLFSAYLKWQPWHSRLHLPFFVLFAPFIGLMMSRIRDARIAAVAVPLLIVMALPWVVFNTARPLVPRSLFPNPAGAMPESIFGTSRINNLFRNQPSWAAPYMQSAQVLSALRCADVGLVLGADDWEYPLWVVWRENLGVVRIEHVNVTNVSQRTEAENPCAVVTVRAGLVTVHAR